MTVWGAEKSKINEICFWTRDAFEKDIETLGLTDGWRTIALWVQRFDGWGVAEGVEAALDGSVWDDRAEEEVGFTNRSVVG